jgi:hypothetical protein
MIKFENWSEIDCCSQLPIKFRLVLLSTLAAMLEEDGTPPRKAKYSEAFGGPIYVLENRAELCTIKSNDNLDFTDGFSAAYYKNRMEFDAMRIEDTFIIIHTINNNSGGPAYIVLKEFLSEHRNSI